MCRKSQISQLSLSLVHNINIYQQCPLRLPDTCPTSSEMEKSRNKLTKEGGISDTRDQAPCIVGIFSFYISLVYVGSFRNGWISSSV